MDLLNKSGVKYVEKVKRGPATYELYTSKSAEKAKTFLLSKKVTESKYYIQVDTPNGYWGMDCEGLYLIKLLPWQKNLELEECEGEICSWPSMFAIQTLLSGHADNAVAEVRCGQCGHMWWDGIRINEATIVRCPECKTYNKIRENQIRVIRTDM